MGKTIQARFSKGRLEPLEHIEADEGEVLTLTIIRLPAKTQVGGLERSAGSWKGLISTRPEPRL